MNVIVGKILEGVKEEAENSENKMKYASVAFLCWCEIPCVSRYESTIIRFYYDYGELIIF
jgi:hypothetical protein